MRSMRGSALATAGVCGTHAVCAPCMQCNNLKDLCMNLLKHDIVTEFPQFKDKIHSLKTDNAHFAKIGRAHV